MRTVIAVDPKGLFLDQIGELAEGSEGLVWYSEQFDTNGYKRNLEAAIREACDRWAREEYAGFLVADARSVTRTDRRP